MIRSALAPRMPYVWFDRRSKTGLKLLIICATLLLSANFANSPRPDPLPAELLLAIGVLIALVRWPNLGLAVLVAGTVVVPWGIGTGTQTTINIAVLLTGMLSVLWLVERAFARDIRLLPSRPIRPLLALIAVSLVAFVNGIQPWTPFAETASIPAQLGGLSIFVLSACGFLLVAHRVREVRTLSYLTWLFLAVATVVTFDRATGEAAARGSTGQVLRTAYLEVANGSMFWLWMVILAFSQAVLNRTLAVRWRLALGVLVTGYMAFALLVNRNWTSGWAPELVAIAVILVVGRPRAAIVLLFGALALLLPKATAVADLLFFANEKNQYDLLTRTAAWEIMGHIISLNPVLGIGFANYYFYTPLYPILGYSVKFNSHNNYIDIVAQTGVIGLAIFLWFFWEIWRLAWRLRSQLPAGFSHAYVCGVIGSVPAMLVAAFMGDWVLPFVYNIGMAGFRASLLAWLFLGGTLVIDQTISRPATGADATAAPPARAVAGGA